ncbi:3-beta hydroxysteroid dehydrogenase/isomerase family protein [Ceratobasidium sp. AG-Ba]|nr:3-beta hydroxysteroid dehydrogenase/isomerase family protein [Ceratobasidium sp. AG-Ba]
MAKHESYLVIGGSGFLGRHIVEALIARGEAEVAVFDIVQRHHDVRFFSGDITNENEVADAIQKANEIYWKVNVDGTKAIISAAQANGVRKLVYTSSAGVVFNGEDLVDVDERLEYPEVPMDAYNETKAEAEKLVLNANGEKGLLTVAIRPAGIFGPGDRQVMKGLMEVVKNGQTKFQIGSNTNLFDWTYVTNVAHAHLLAADKLDQTLPSKEDMLNSPLPPVSLTTEPNPHRIPTSSARPLDSALAKEEVSPLAVAGQAFFITNGEPVYFWDFTRAVWRATGHVPSSRVVFPKDIGMALAGAAEWWSWITGVKQGSRGSVGLEEGIQRMADWWKQEQAAKAA